MVRISGNFKISLRFKGKLCAHHQRKMVRAALTSFPYSTRSTHLLSTLLLAIAELITENIIKSEAQPFSASTLPSQEIVQNSSQPSGSKQQTTKLPNQTEISQILKQYPEMLRSKALPCMKLFNLRIIVFYI